MSVSFQYVLHIISIIFIFHLLNGDRGSLVRDSSGHCVVSLSKTLLYNLLSTGSTKEDRRKTVVVIEKNVEWNVKHQRNHTCNILICFDCIT